MQKISDFPVNSSNPYQGILYNPNPIIIAIGDFGNFSKVNGNGMKLLDYIFKHHFSNITVEYIYLNQEEIENYIFGKRSKASNAYVYRAILSLLEANILHRSITKNYYWFNLSVIRPYYLILDIIK